MSDEVKISDEDVAILKAFQEVIRIARLDLGNLRANYLALETQIINRIIEAEKDLDTYIQKIAENKGISLSNGEDWSFDPSILSFKKKNFNGGT